MKQSIHSCSRREFIAMAGAGSAGIGLAAGAGFANPFSSSALAADASAGQSTP